MKNIILPLALFASVLACSTAGAAEIRVIDGDTLSDGEITYRLNGIDAPESGQTCLNSSGTSWRCGEAATAFLVDLLANSDLKCQAMARDRYGRTIATCFASGTDLGKSLVEAGLAWSFRRYDDVYSEAEETAKARHKGVWTGVNQAPWEYREERWTAAKQSAPEGCPIKGNISKNGKIYHAPWSPWYSRTKISPAKGERWFCNEADAIAAGWRAPHWH
ncbi:thermonuclease family protein [Donghicola eburneus]|uniref:thermonuclease family protein n=1 Tax=Donghicola eburneus TaxID=393278 RepID=UPI0008EFD760|nr:thermonuclease family protein [Donghicola eburneus]SFQ66313.1 Endonuclease YncB, thermonuclease family [Donghicola eburneus]